MTYRELILISACCILVGCASNKKYDGMSSRSEHRVVYRDLSHSVLPPMKVATEVPAPSAPVNSVLDELVPDVIEPPADIIRTSTTSSANWVDDSVGIIDLPDQPVTTLFPESYASSFHQEPYKVYEGEYLSQIASRFARLGGTLGQRMTAIYKKNPHAFTNGDPEKLEAFSNLYIPTREQILAAEPMFQLKGRLQKPSTKGGQR